ncbi:MAG: hypothetical protein K2I27_04945, partial [Bacteroides sp.]|nr:hypothetical protein [Bacteroides sp.]
AKIVKGESRSKKTKLSFFDYAEPHPIFTQSAKIINSLQKKPAIELKFVNGGPFSILLQQVTSLP